MEDMNIKVKELNLNINMEPVEIFNQYYGTDLEFQPTDNPDIKINNLDVEDMTYLPMVADKVSIIERKIDDYTVYEMVFLLTGKAVISTLVGKVQNNEFIPFSNEEFKDSDSLIPSYLEVRLKQR
jgi:hypothetical protein